MGYKELHETNRYPDPSFPVGVYTVTPLGIEPDGRGYRDLHWHEELQFTLVTRGKMSMRVNGEDHSLCQGQAIFINRNLLHMTTELSEQGQYISVNFPEKMLGFFPGSRMEQDYVTPYAGNTTLPAVVLSAEEPWQQKAVAQLKTLITLLTAQEKPPGFAYQAAIYGAELWFQLISHLPETVGTPTSGDQRRQQRVREMLSFIHEHFREPITLEQVAGAAHVSKGECCRCFQAMVRQSPMQYLQSYRISQGQELLAHSDLSVTEVAVACGIDVSHFIQYFRRITGMTPLEYRKRFSHNC